MTAACRNCFGTAELQRQRSAPDNVDIGEIFLWPNSIASIPEEFVLCDGNNDTPDLRDVFVPGSGDIYAVNDSGGNLDHDHTFTGDGHDHIHGVGPGILSGAGINAVTTGASVTGTMDSAATLPAFRRLAFIMFTG